MARHSASVDRMVRLELLRARAALEREALAQGIVEAGRTLTPGNMVKSIWPSLGKANTSRLFWQAFALVRRYPFVSSTLSAMVMGRGARRSGLLKLAGVALVGWQAYRIWQSAREERQAE
ncbi:hypothetical protein [Bordetella bronchiseptica]|uniref:hypothetical protein n=1 Tax=Bordetella bronchiseptica TaxID=518 RepID=UPI000460F475|nr:hypothetical protein [Bordetella bronchiseptica]KDB59098.1 PF11780 family protein [Bordetella bronchiseptica A1-7]KDB73940.1 PF11780 family protein [Bordetella bronchiseptica B20-10725633]KDC44949.1 PF11780 family protein [Bordetella bronchiseptica M85/00/2]